MNVVLTPNPELGSWVYATSPNSVTSSFLRCKNEVGLAMIDSMICIVGMVGIIFFDLGRADLEPLGQVLLQFLVLLE